MAETTEAAAVEPYDKIDALTLKNIIADEIENALGKDGDVLSTQRMLALKHYLGEPYGTEKNAPSEVEGRSQVVDRTVMETVEWILPALLRIFTGSDKIVNVEPQAPEDEDIAKQQTEYANYIFNRDNPGFFNLYTWFKDALLQKMGWLKIYWDTERKVETEQYQGLTDEQRDAILIDPNVEETEHEDYPAYGPDMGLVHAEDATTGGDEASYPRKSPGKSPIIAGISDLAPRMHDITIQRTTNEGRVRIEPVAPEEMLISKRARTVQGTHFICHRRQITKTELLEMGFDKDIVANLAYFDEQEFNQERIERQQASGVWPYTSVRTDEAMVTTWINECQIKVDWNNDGKAELRKVVTAGTKTTEILSNDDADDIPFVAITPILMPHTLVGLSLEDIVRELQAIKTALTRQTLDNLYLANNGRTYVNEKAVSENTYDDLLTSRPGGIVRGNGPKDQVLGEFNTEFVAAQTFPMFEYIDQLVEKRSGVSKGNQGLAPDDLNKNSAIGSMGIGMLQEAAAQRVELIARIFGEGLKDVMGKVLGLVARNQQSPRVVKLTGQWTPVDPTSWKHSFDLSVAVGLGTGNNDKLIGYLMQLLGMQKEGIALQGGINGPLFTGENIYHTFKQLVSTMGFKNTDDYVTDPAKAPPQQPQPNPDVQKEQIKAQAKAQGDQMKIQAQGQADQQKTQAQMGMAAMKAQADQQTAQMKLAAESQMKMFQLQMEDQMKKYQTDVAAMVDVHIGKMQSEASAVKFGGKDV